MPTESKRGVDPRIRGRDAGLRRLRRATALGLAAAGALSVVFGELAAKAFSGRSSTTTTVVTATTAATSTTATPPPLVSAGSAARAAAASAAQAPTKSQAPPVAVSGGT
jgi:hypothetical protein